MTNQERKPVGPIAALRHPLAIAVAGALLASWLIPALTKQWQDRQQERELKTELATDLDEMTTRTVIEARIINERGFREAQATDARKAELRAAARGDRARAASAYRLAVEKERDAAAASSITLFAEWLIARSVIRSKLAAYYPQEALAHLWEEYANHVTYYVLLASSGSNRKRKKKFIGTLGAFLDEDPRWVLANDPRTVSPKRYLDYAKADALLSDRLLRKKNDLVRGVLDAHIAGFSTDVRGLVKDVVPFYG